MEELENISTSELFYLAQFIEKYIPYGDHNNNFDLDNYYAPQERLRSIQKEMEKRIEKIPRTPIPVIS